MPALRVQIPQVVGPELIQLSALAGENAHLGNAPLYTTTVKYDLKNGDPNGGATIVFDKDAYGLRMDPGVAEANGLASARGIVCICIGDTKRVFVLCKCMLYNTACILIACICIYDSLYLYELYLYKTGLYRKQIPEFRILTSASTYEYVQLRIHNVNMKVSKHI